MAILGFFKKDKSKPSASQSSSSSLAVAAEDPTSSEEYVLSPPSGFLPTAGNGDDGYASSSASFVSAASSRKIRLLFTKKHHPTCQSPLTRSQQPARGLGNISSDKLSLSLDSSFDASSSRKAVFPSFHHPNSSPAFSTPDTDNRPQATPVQKPNSSGTSKASGGLFSWRERKKSKASKPDLDSLILPPLPDESFNLKSFRHVLPEQRSEPPRTHSPGQSASSSSLVPPARPRGASVASTDSSQRISVAAFREAQARRSSTNLVSNSPSPTIRPVSVANSTISDNALPRRSLHSRSPASTSASPTPGRAGKANPSRQSKLSSSSDTSSSEESDSDDGSPSRSRSHLSRQRTITRRSYGATSDLGHGSSRVADYSRHQQTSSSRSEAGHGLSTRASHASGSPSRGPPPSSFPKSAEGAMGTRSFSLYRRQRASYSTSELTPNAAAQRASTLVRANKRELAAAHHQVRGDNIDSDSNSDSSDDEDAPLAALRHPKRPGSSLSHRSNATSGSSRRPLIDLNMKSNPLTGKPVVDEPRSPQQKEGATLISPTNINGRLLQLASSAGLGDHRSKSASKSEANLSRISSSRPAFVDCSKPDSPASTDTVVPPSIAEAQKVVVAGPRRASFSALSDMQNLAQAKSKDLRPVPVVDRPDRNSGFRVVSRPQKSATTPPSFPSCTEPSRNVLNQHMAASHQRQSSSPTLIANSHLQNSTHALATASLSASKNGSTASGSSASGASSSPQALGDAQASSRRSFAVGGKRQESPASSTGGSSNGKAPLTPMDGSDYFSPDVRGSGDSPGGSSASATPLSAMKGARGHLKRASVSFQEPVKFDKDVTVRGRKSSLGSTKVEDQNSLPDRENRQRERRRSEAKAAIELANVINGRRALEQEDDNEDAMMAPRIPPMNTGSSLGINLNNMQMGWHQQGMQSPIMAHLGMNGPSSMGGGMGMGMGMGLNPSQFMLGPPPPGADPAFLAAHQQAMHIAKQAYQYAVAQQAMAAAADEWERGSSVSAYTAPGGSLGVSMGGYGSGGMNAMWGGGVPMFPPAPRSMYGANVGANVGGGMGEAGWGTASVYGEPFGPSMAANARRSHVRNSSAGGSASVIGFPTSYQRTESAGNAQQDTGPSARSTARPRTRTSPSNAPLPSQQRHSRGPPSSWKVGT